MARPQPHCHPSLGLRVYRGSTSSSRSSHLPVPLAEHAMVGQRRPKHAICDRNLAAHQTCFKPVLSSSASPSTCTTTNHRGMLTSTIDQVDHPIGRNILARARAVPCHDSGRFTRRPDVVPLAPIAEQGSYSTLNSHHSTLSMHLRKGNHCRQSPCKAAVERTNHINSQNEPSQASYDDHGVQILLKGGNSSLVNSRDHNTNNEADTSHFASSAEGLICDMDSNLYARSRGSSAAELPDLELRGHRMMADIGNMRIGPRYPLKIARSVVERCRTLIPARTPASTLEINDHIGSGTTLPSTSKICVPIDPSDLPNVSSVVEDTSKSRDIIHSDPIPSTCSFDGGHDRQSVHDTVYGKLPLNDGIVSLNGSDMAKDSSRNASFCSTWSSSYSGTVLGVDLDLENRDSDGKRSPPFSITMGQKGSDKSASSSPVFNSESEFTYEHQQLITSSALTTLLPVAVALGIVVPDLNGQQTSFFTPSGNLIRLQEGVSSDTACFMPFIGAFPTIFPGEKKQKRKRKKHSSCPISLQSAYPSLVQTILPVVDNLQAAAALPPTHFRCCDNHQYPPAAQAGSLTTVFTATHPVKGYGKIAKGPALMSRRLKHFKCKRRDSGAQPKFH